MTYDPFQAYSAIGAHPGLSSPFASPFNAFQTPVMNPMAALNPLAGIHPQQLQLAQILAARAAAQQFFGASPFTGGLQNPLGITSLDNPLMNPLAQFQLPQQTYGLNAPVGQFGLQGGQAGLPYPQQLLPYSQQFQPYPQQLQPYSQQFQPYPQQLQPYSQQFQGLAPQSWIGQPGIHPLVAQQLAGRGLHAPWTGF